LDALAVKSQAARIADDGHLPAWYAMQALNQIVRGGQQPGAQLIERIEPKNFVIRSIVENPAAAVDVQLQHEVHVQILVGAAQRFDDRFERR
jgi:hypothetical protein